MADNYLQFSGSFVPTTNIWDTSSIADIDVNSAQFKELLVRLYQNVNNIAIVLNSKDTGLYTNQNPFVNGQTWFPDPALSSQTPEQPVQRQVARLVINFGALPNTGTKSVAHGLSPLGNWSFTRIYGCASDQSGLNYIPLPYASSTAANNIELYVDGTNVNVKTGSNRSSFTVTYIILEFIQQ
jgi:hypothetical protein